MNRSLPILGILLAGALIVLSQTFFIVDQRKQAVIVRLGEPVRVINAPGDPGPGLKVKVPFAASETSTGTATASGISWARAARRSKSRASMATR